MEVENKPGITIPLIKDYDVSRGDQFLIQEIDGTYTWSVQVICKNLAGGSLNGVVTLLCSNQLEKDSLTYFSPIPEITAMTLNKANGSFVKDDFKFAFKYIGAKFEQKALISGTIDIILVLNKCL